MRCSKIWKRYRQIYKNRGTFEEYSTEEIFCSENFRRPRVVYLSPNYYWICKTSNDSSSTSCTSILFHSVKNNFTHLFQFYFPEKVHF
jgi:hypothetical protein